MFITIHNIYIHINIIHIEFRERHKYICIYIDTYMETPWIDDFDISRSTILTVPTSISVTFPLFSSNILLRLSQPVSWSLSDVSYLEPP